MRDAGLLLRHDRPAAISSSVYIQGQRALVSNALRGTGLRWGRYGLLEL